MRIEIDNINKRINEKVTYNDTLNRIIEYENEPFCCNKIEVKNKMKILELYEERAKLKIRQEYDEKIEEIKSFDSVQTLVKETEEQLNVLFDRQENNKIYIEIMNIDIDELYDEITKVKIQQVDKESNNKMRKIDDLIEEVEALLSMTDNYDEQVKILKKYNILNKDGKLNV